MPRWLILPDAVRSMPLLGGGPTTMVSRDSPASRARVDGMARARRTTSALSAPSSPSQSSEPPERCECEEDNKGAESEVSAEREHYGGAQQTRQDTYKDTVSLGSVGYSTDTPCQQERQERFKPRHHSRADRRCEVIDRGLVRNSPSLESQDERVGSDDAHQDQEAQHDDRCRGA